MSAFRRRGGEEGRVSFLAGSDVPQTITSRHQPEFACSRRWLYQSLGRLQLGDGARCGCGVKHGAAHIMGGWLLLVWVNQLLRPFIYCLGLRSCFRTAEYRPQSSSPAEPKVVCRPGAPRQGEGQGCWAGAGQGGCGRAWGLGRGRPLREGQVWCEVNQGRWAFGALSFLLLCVFLSTSIKS